jgi:hypothetical protein
VDGVRDYRGGRWASPDLNPFKKCLQAFIKVIIK